MELGQQGTRDTALAKYLMALQAATQPLLYVSQTNLVKSHCPNLLDQAHTSFLALFCYLKTDKGPPFPTPHLTQDPKGFYSLTPLSLPP